MRWWVTGRSSDSLRLTDEGRQAFDQAEIEFFDYPLFTEQELKNMSKAFVEGSKFTMKLKKINCPFYIGKKTQYSKSLYIRVYDSKVAMMIGLYGTFTEYLDSIRKS